MVQPQDILVADFSRQCPWLSQDCGHSHIWRSGCSGLTVNAWVLVHKTWCTKPSGCLLDRLASGLISPCLASLWLWCPLTLLWRRESPSWPIVGSHPFPPPCLSWLCISGPFCMPQRVVLQQGSLMGSLKPCLCSARTQWRSVSVEPCWSFLR